MARRAGIAGAFLMGRPTLGSVLIAAVLVAAAIPLALRAQDVFSTTTGGSAPLQGGVSTTEPAEPGHTRPTGTQGIEGNPDCPPPVMADGTSPKNWSCTTGNQGVVGNPDCPAPVSADGTSPKNWSCRTGTQGVEGNPNCPPPVIQGGMIPRNWSCAGPDMQPDPLTPLRDPDIAIDYRGDPGVPPLMRANATTEEEEAVAAVLTCRRAVVEGIERPSQADMAEYVCDDQGKALDMPPFQLRAEENVDQTVCILPLKSAVQELKAGKMLLMKAKDSAGAERDWHMSRGNAHLLRASISVDRSDICLVENPPRRPAAQQPGAPRRQQRPPVDMRAILRNPCEPVAGMDPRIRGALDANCPKAPAKGQPAQPPRQAQPQPQPQPQPPLQAQQPKTDSPDDDCEVAPPPLDIREMMMDFARRRDRDVAKFQDAGMKAANRFFTGMNEVVQQQLVFLAQERGKPASQIAEKVMAHLNNNALENHNKLLADAQKAVEDFVKDPTYESGKMVSNYLIGKVQGAATDRLPGGTKFCAAASRRATEETRKLEGAIKASGELDKMAKQTSDAADGAKACRITPRAASQDQRFRAAMQKKKDDEMRQRVRQADRAKTRPQRKQAADRQAAAQAQRDKAWREDAKRKQMAVSREQQKIQDEARGKADAGQLKAYRKQVDEMRDKQAQAIRDRNLQADDKKLAEQQRMKSEPPRRPTPPTLEEAAQQRQAQQAARQRAIDDARQQNAPRRAAAAQPKQETSPPEQPRRAEERQMADQARLEQKARAERRAAAGGDVPRQPADPGDTVRMRPEGGDTVRMRPEGGDTVRIPREAADAPRVPPSEDYRAAAEQMRLERQAAAAKRLPGVGDTVQMRPEGGDTVRLPSEGSYGGSAAPGSGVDSLKPLLEQKTPVNPFGEANTCFPTSVAADLRKQFPNRPYTDSDILRLGAGETVSPATVQDVLKKHYGHREFAGHGVERKRAQAEGSPVAVRSSDDIRKELAAGGEGARGIVFVRNKQTGSGHVVSADRAGSGAKFFDHQNGTDGTMWATISDLAPDAFEMFFFRTN